MPTDWPALRLEYINGTMAQRELAALRNVSPAALMKRANREGWETERKRLSAEVSKKAQAQLSQSREEQLAKFNDDDLRMARAIRGIVARRLADQGEKMSTKDLAALTSAAERVQKIGRLALGANTDNTTLSGPEGGALAINVLTGVPRD